MTTTYDILGVNLENIPRLSADQARTMSLNINPLFYKREEDIVCLAIYEAALSKRSATKVSFRISDNLVKQLEKEGYKVIRKKVDLLENMNLYTSMSPESLLYRWHDVTYIMF